MIRLIAREKQIAEIAYRLGKRSANTTSMVLGYGLGNLLSTVLLNSTYGKMGALPAKKPEPIKSPYPPMTFGPGMFDKGNPK